MLYYGIIQKLYPPGDPANANKYQYEYLVLVSMENYAQIPIHHVTVSEEFGSDDDFNDRTFKVGQKVYLQAPMGDWTAAVIVGAVRNSERKTDDLLGHHWRRRFNKIEQIIDKDYGWTLKSDSGPSMKLNPKFIIIDSSVGDKITLDVENKTLTVDSNDLIINVTKNATINVEGDSTITTKGVMKLIASAIHFLKEDGSGTEPFVLGATFVKMMKKLIQAIIAHTHIGNLGAPTAPPINAPQFAELMSSPIGDKKILSDFIKGE
jgi:hypothetical protein